MTPAPSTGRPRHVLALAAILVAATVVVYWPALTGGFLWDDDVLLTKSELVKAADGLYRMWFTTQPLDYWPLTNSSFWLEWRLWGMNPAGYHATNLVLHIVSALLLWAVLRRLAIPGAWLAAALFALHPVNVESVAWIAQRKNTLSMVWFLTSVLLYLRALSGDPDRRSPLPARDAEPREPLRGQPKARVSNRPTAPAVRSLQPAGRPVWYGLSLLAFILAMLSKGSVAVLPPILLLIVWWKRGALTARDVLDSVPFFAVAAALTVVNIWFQTHSMGGSIRHVTLLERVLGAGAVVWFYLFKAVWPAGLSFVYPEWVIRADRLQWWLPVAAAAAVTAVLVWRRRSPVVRALLFAWLFFGLALVPVMGFTDVYFMTYTLVADHFQYIAIIGVVAAAAAGAAWAADRTGAGAAARTAACAAVLFAAGGATWLQARHYVDAETLYRSAADANPAFWLPHNMLGWQYADRSLDEAVAEFRTAARLNPASAEAHNSLCQVLGRAGHAEEAVSECFAVVRLDPNVPAAHNGLGAALASLHRPDEARVEFETAIRLNPSLADAHNNLANVLMAAGHASDAIEQYRLALNLTPDFADAHMNLGLALERQGQTDEAVSQYREAFRIDPALTLARDRAEALSQRPPDARQAQDLVAKYAAAVKQHPNSVDAHQEFGDLLQDLGRLPEAADQYARALEANPRSAESHNNLGVVLVRLGHVDEGIEHFRAALAINPAYADARANLTKVLDGRRGAK